MQRMNSPLDHLDDCQGMRYRLQLHCYRYLLQKYYDAVVSGMRVVCTHPDNGLALSSQSTLLDRITHPNN